MRKAKPVVELQVSALSQLADALRFNYEARGSYAVICATLMAFRQDQLLTDGQYLKVVATIQTDYNHYIAPYCDVKQVGYGFVVIPHKKNGNKYGDEVFEKLRKKAKENGY